MKAKKSIKNSVAVGAAFALALCLAACSTSEEPEAVEVTQASDGGGDVSVSDGGGAEVEVEEEKQMPDVIAAYEPPKKEDYPYLGEQSRAGANDHARFFVDTMLYGFATGDAEPLSQIYDPTECGICLTAQRDIEENAEKGYFFDNYDKLEPIEAEFMGFDSEDQAVVFYLLEIGEHKGYTWNQADEDIPAQRVGVEVRMFDYGDGWVIRDMETSSEDI